MKYRTLFLAASLFFGTVALIAEGNQEVLPPSIDLDIPAVSYLSPASSPGVQDELTLPLDIAAAEKMVLKSYRLTLYSADGSEAYVEQEQFSEEVPFFEQLLINMGFHKLKKAIVPPDWLTIDGTDTAGNPLDEGEYTLTLEAVDDEGNRGVSDEYTLIIDNTAPQAAISVPYTVFSPNGDGKQDIFIIEQSGSIEDAWSAVVSDSTGLTVKTWNYTAAAPQNLTWDGTADSGAVVSDGTYRYSITATDRAGNRTVTEAVAFSLDTRDTPIALSRDFAVFSPNDDGEHDSIFFLPEIPILEGIQSWNIEVRDASGTTLRRFSGEVFEQSYIEFDGRDEEGRILPEGPYTGVIDVLYLNGNHPQAESPRFTVDLTPPEVKITAVSPIFSPNGDGNLDYLEVHQTTSEEEQWTGVIKSADGREIRRVFWRGRADAVVRWDGLDTANVPVPDGKYTYVLYARDRGGNFTQSPKLNFEIDTRATPVTPRFLGTHFSPNGDNTQDSIAIETGIENFDGVLNLEIAIIDGNGDTVRRFRFDEGIDKLVWDGKMEDGRTAPDGEYRLTMAMQYRNGNNPRGTAGPIVLDTVFPSIELDTAYRIFSPDGDGNQDDLTIVQNNASREDLWTGYLLDDKGSLVRSEVWQGEPGNFVWDGRDETGNQFNDGVYSYKAFCVDKAGNFAEFILSGITIDTRPTPVAVRIDRSAFSPNSDGVNDTLTFTPVLEVEKNIVSWNMKIISAKGESLRTYLGGAEVPGALLFDGRDYADIPLPEGVYRAKLEVLYVNGSNPTEDSPEFEIDLTPPTAAATLRDTILSPDGDGNKDTIVFDQSGSAELVWKGHILNAEGEKVREFDWYAGLPSSNEWDGKDGAGKLLPDGEYAWYVESIDKAGNYGRSESISFTVDTRATPITLTPELSVFSPNNDGRKDTITFRAGLAIQDGVTDYTFTVFNPFGTVIHQETGAALSGTFRWNGKNLQGKTAPDGLYSAKLQVGYYKGNRPEAVSSRFSLDNTFPSVEFNTDYTLFSPDGDGRRDTVTLNQDSSREDLWEGEIRDAAGKTVRSWFWKGNTDALVWNGRNDNGDMLPDGEYRYVLTSTDQAGNAFSKTFSGLTIDNRSVSGYVTGSVYLFSPNGDGYHDSVKLNLYLGLREGISAWSVKIFDEKGLTVRNLDEGKNDRVPASLVWDGKTDRGRTANGSYFAELTVEYEKGNLLSKRNTNPIVLDVAPPDYTLSLSPLPFSPDNDGIADVLFMQFRDIEDVTDIAGWTLTILDPKGNLFYETEGTGKPLRQLTWDGTSFDGELVQAAQDYTVVTTMTDAHRNTAERRTVLPVDILVIRDGENLKIRISSIQFAPNSADFREFDAEKAEKNMKTLARLAEILDKYSAYDIRIEGHAVSVYWEDAARAAKEEREELQPLSKARADAIKTALVEMGIRDSRISTAGMGGTQPLVPHSDLENRWKSRRVEFILIK